MKRVATVVLMAALAVSAPGMAQAAIKYWNSQSSPLTLSGMGQGYGSVSFSRTASGGAYNHDFNGRGTIRDLAPGGNSIYWRADIRYSQGSGYLASMKQESTRYNGSSWRLFTRYHRATVNVAYTVAVVDVSVCEDRRLASDPCRKNALGAIGF